VGELDSKHSETFGSAMPATAFIVVAALVDPGKGWSRLRPTPCSLREAAPS
jgi:hypothetical protein